MKVTDNNLTNRKITGISSGRARVWFDNDDTELQINVKQLPPFTKFPDVNKSSYKFLGTTITTRGETIEKYSVRKRKKHKDKHFTLKCSMSTKTGDIESIEDVENTEKYKIVTTYLRLPKSTVRNLRDEFNEFLNPNPIPINNPTKHTDNIEKIINIIETKTHAFGIITMLLKKDEITIEDVMDRFKVSKPSATKYLKQLKQISIIEVEY